MSLEDKRRDGFEAWYCEDFYRLHGFPARHIEAMRGESGDYIAHPALHGKWIGWNAALDSVVIELPDEWTTNVGRMLTPPAVRSAIESAGLKVKP